MASAATKTVIFTLCMLFSVLQAVELDDAVSDISNNTKIGICPKSLETPLNCSASLSECEIDSHCDENQKCCYNGCGNVCAYPVFTGCQQLRSLTQKQSSSVTSENRIHVPECQENGMFKDIQCDDELGKCWCVDDLGFELAGTRENSSDLVNCSNPRPCADVLCRMLCPYGFELDPEGCPICRCRNPCSDIQCPGEQECQLEEIPCAEDICPPLPTCKQPRRLEDLCPMGTPLSSPENGNPFLCGREPNKPQCPPNFLCDVIPGNDYGVCCPLVDKAGRCPTELHFGDTCGDPCNADIDCIGASKCCTIEGCGMTCTKPANTTLCLQQKAVVEILLSGRGENGYIPQCTEEGEFVPMQCSSNGNLCWCVTVNGTIISGTMGPKDKVKCEEPKLEFEGRVGDEVEARTQGNMDVSFVCPKLNCDYECKAGYKYDGKGCRTCECLEPCKDVDCPEGTECIVRRDDNCFDNDCPYMPICVSFAECHWGKALLSNTTRSVIHCQDGECPNTHFCEMKGENGICCPKQVEIEHTKDSECPDYIYEPQQCNSICKSDSHCDGEMKCCPSKVCGAICVPPKPPKPPTMCEYIRDSGIPLQRPEGNATLAIPHPQCLSSGPYSPKQCDDNGECWCVDEFGVEIIKTRTNNADLDCDRVRDDMACLGLICRLGCDFGFVMDEEGCPLCSCRNPCQNATCKEGETCQFLEVDCGDDWCPPLPYCVPLDASTRHFAECPVGSMLYDYDNEPVLCDPFSNYPQCPGTHDCVVNSPRDVGICCPRIIDTSAEETEKRGQCPYLIPVSGESCDYQCASDIDCHGITKCCSNGCGTQCVEPIMKTACQHLKSAAEHRAIEMGVPASHVFMPNCTDSGDFAPVQCNPVEKNCWCVDASGAEIQGTRVTGRDRITCIPQVTAHCEPIDHYCDLSCPLGYEIDENGCSKCECKDPCKDVKCKSNKESCRLVTVNCISEPCTPIPLCLPKIENPCPIGDPLTDGEFGNPIECGPLGEQCPSSHRCHLSPFGEYAVCCPKPIISTCEQLKKRNQQLRKMTNRVTFLPKCNKKTGAWDPTQCMEALGLCWCVDPEGNQLPGTLIRGVPHCTARSGKSLQNTPICNDGTPAHVCPDHLCKSKVCLGYPNATCNIDPCGGCKIQFLDDFDKPVDCNHGLTACFAEVQEIINSGVLRPKDNIDDDILPELEEIVEDMMSIPPPAYPPPPPPPKFSKLQRRSAVFDYDYENSNSLPFVEYETPEYDNLDLQALQSTDASVVVLPPRVHAIQIKMVPQTRPVFSPRMQPMMPMIDLSPIQALTELLGPEHVEVYGISQRFTIMDDPIAMLTEKAICTKPTLIDILKTISSVNNCLLPCTTNADCYYGGKCCLYNCGLSCFPYSQLPRQRKEENECPALSPNIFTCMFMKKCFNNQDCNMNERCCPTICGNQCLPVKEQRKELKPVLLQAAAPRCSVEGGYAITQKQGELSWCVDQYGHALHETLTRGIIECDNNGTIILQKRNGPVCPDKNQIPRVCKDECLQAECDEHPEAICIADPCNDCAVQFILPDGSPVSCEGKCKQPLAVGSCRSSLMRYYFNQENRKCEPFTYTGCQGNDNNFQTLQACQAECEVKVPRCDQPKEVGLCRAQIFRWFYNRNTHQCEQFIYGGCSGNDNNFETQEECERTCPELVVCPWINVNGEDILPCNRTAACENASCLGRPDAICTVADSCTCKASFIVPGGNALDCLSEEVKQEIEHIPDESTATLRTAALSKNTRCQSLLKRHLLTQDPTYIPQCTETGEFYPVQCSRENEPQCWCVDEAGMQLPSSQKFPKGTKTCKFVKVKKVEVTLAFTHTNVTYSELMKPAIQRLIEQFLKNLGAEFSQVTISVLPHVTQVMFTLFSDNKVQIAFQLEEMMRMENIFIILPQAKMAVDYRLSHFYHILEPPSDMENNGIAADRINEILAARTDYNWPFFAVFLSIACMVLFFIFYIIPVIIRKRKKEKELTFEEKPKPSLVNVVLRNVRYSLTGKKSKMAEIASEQPKVVIQTVEAEYESLQKKEEPEKKSNEAPPAYDDISEKDVKTEDECKKI